MNYLIINKDIIINNCKNIKEKLDKHEFYMFLMVKSNLYGYGYKLLKYISDYVDGMVVKDSFVLNEIPELGKKIIKLYDNKNFDNVSNCLINYNDLNKINNYNCFIRLDPFLGMHGVTFEELKKIDNLSSFKGILIYINEYLNRQEIKILNEIVEIANQNNLILNIGGSVILDKLNYINCKKTEVRILRKILFSEGEQSSMYLKCNILNKIHLNEKTFIGFKSDRRAYDKGYLYLVSIGYDDFKLLPLMYKNNLKIRILNKDYDIACYPCMNTMWIYSDSDALISNELVLFDNNQNIIDICKKLDIDLDEFYSSYSLEIKRKYM